MASGTIPFPTVMSETATASKTYSFPPNFRALVCVTDVVSSSQQLGLYHFGVNGAGNAGYLVTIFETPTHTGFSLSVSGAELVLTRNSGVVVVNIYRSN